MSGREELLAVLEEYGLPLTGDDELDIWEFGELEVHREKRRRAAIAAAPAPSAGRGTSE